MRIRTLEELQDLIDADFVWRKKELIELSLTAHSSQNPLYSRVGVSMLCAHFEGFIRQISNYYVIYVSSQNIPFSRLKSNFLAIRSKKKMRLCAESDKVSIYSSFLTSLLHNYNGRTFRIKYSVDNPIIKTGGSPSSTVFKEIVHSIGLEFSPYETKCNYIDTDLLSNRHKIVHGEKLNIEIEDFRQTLTNVMEIMETYGKQVFLAALNQDFIVNPICE